RAVVLGSTVTGLSSGTGGSFTLAHSPVMSRSAGFDMVPLPWAVTVASVTSKTGQQKQPCYLCFAAACAEIFFCHDRRRHRESCRKTRARRACEVPRLVRGVRS